MKKKTNKSAASRNNMKRDIRKEELAIQAITRNKQVCEVAIMEHRHAITKLEVIIQRLTLRHIDRNNKIDKLFRGVHR